MQFHLNGFEPGDPEIADREERVRPSGAPGPVPAEVDVLIVGCGPAGLNLAAQLSAFPDIKTCIVELKEACWINETTFWKPDPAKPDTIVRSGRVQDVEDGLSEFPHVVLNQARVHDFYLDVMHKSPARLEPYYARRLIDLAINEAGDSADPYQVTARLERV